MVTLTGARTVTGLVLLGAVLCMAAALVAVAVHQHRHRYAAVYDPEPDDTNPAPTKTPLLTMDHFQQELDSGRPPVSVGTSHAGGIPKVVWRTGPYALPDLPAPARAALNSLTNQSPDLVQVYSTDAECDAFVRRHFPQHWEDYDALIPGAYRADVWRLMVLLVYGGVYVDAGFVFFMPLQRLVNFSRDDLVLVGDLPYKERIPQGLFQAFLAAPAGHPIIAAMLALVMDNVHRRTYSFSILAITGPVAVAEAFRTYLGLPKDTPMDTFGSRVVVTPKGTGHAYVVRVHKFKPGRIVDATGATVIRTKFPNYTKIMYSGRGTLPYGALWHARAVYKDRLPLE